MSRHELQSSAKRLENCQTWVGQLSVDGLRGSEIATQQEVGKSTLQDSPAPGANSLSVMERERNELPVNIERLRKQWLSEGLYPAEPGHTASLTAEDNGAEKPVASEATAVVTAPSGNGSRAKQAHRQGASDEAIGELREEVQRLKESHLFELRSLKGLTLDLASVVCELAEQLTQRKRPWYRFWRK